MSYLLDDLIEFEKTAMLSDPDNLWKDSEKAASLLNRYEGHEDVGAAKKQLVIDHRKSVNMPTHRNRTDAEISKLKYRDVKARVDMSKQKKKSPRELALAAKYQEKGLTPQEAELKAFRAHRTKKRLMMGAGAAAAVGAGVGAYKYHDYVTDRTIKAGQTMQNVRAGEDRHFDKGDPYFIAHAEKDKVKYRGMYGTQLGGEDIHKADLEATQDIKIPSRKKTKQAFKEMVEKDPENLRILKDGIRDAKGTSPGWSKDGRNLLKAEKKLSKGKIDGSVYDAAQLRFTKGYRDRNPEFSDKIEKKLYESLKSQGYHGIRDRHDEKYSGYDAKSAHILFDTKDRVKVKSDEVLPKDQITKEHIQETGKSLGRFLSPKLVGAAGIGASVKGLKNHVEEKEQDRRIQEYRRKNPESNLSYADILKKGR